MLKLLGRSVLMTACVTLLAALTTPASAQDEGAALFKAKCSSCHGLDGSGRTAAAKKLDIPDLRSKDVQSLSDEALFQTIAHGSGHKESPHAFSYRGMPEEEVRLLVKHIRQLAAAHKPAPASHPKGKSH